MYIALLYDAFPQLYCNHTSALIRLLGYCLHVAWVCDVARVCGPFVIAAKPGRDPVRGGCGLLGRNVEASQSWGSHVW